MDHRSICRLACARTRLTEARDRTVDQSWIPRAEGFEVETELLHDARPEVFDDDVRSIRQPKGGFPPLIRRQIDDDSALPTVHGGEEGADVGPIWGPPPKGNAGPSPTLNHSQPCI